MEQIRRIDGNLQKTTSLATALFLITIVLALSSCKTSMDSGLKKALPYTVQKGDFEKKITLSGVVTANRTSYMVAPFQGYISNLYVRLGQNVPANLPLFRISLAPGNSEDNSNFPVRAPLAGTVTQIFRKMGDSANANDSVLRIDDLSQLMIQCEVPELFIDLITPKMKARIQVPALNRKSYEGEVFDSNLSSTSTGNDWRKAGKVEFSVRIRVLNADQRLLPGMSVTSELIAAQVQNALLIPHEYVSKSGDSSKATLTNGKKVDLKLGLQNEDMIQVLDGLQVGDTVEPIDFTQGPES